MLDPNVKIAFVGGGNMAQAIISGLIKHGHSPSSILVCAPSTETRMSLAGRFHVNVEKNNTKAVQFADVIILAVKPHLISEVCMELSDEMYALQKSALVISVAAGIKHQFVSQNLRNSKRVVCAMPNLPSAICKGMIGMHTGLECDVQDVAMAQSVMRAIGETVWVEEENQMPAIVAAAGSSPAYFFLIMEAMEKTAIEQGLTEEVARLSVIQSALGAVMMAAAGNESFKQLREKVTSERGSTERAIATLKDNNIEKVISDAMESAAEKVDQMYRVH